MMQTTTADAGVRELLARQQIYDSIMRYCRGVDRLDADLIRSAYHPGARDNHGGFDGPVDKFIEWVQENHSGKVMSSVHHIGNVLITFESQTVAYSESYVLAYHRRMIDGRLYDLSSHGRFVDRHEERNGQWKIVDRLVVFDWDRLDPVERQWAGPLTLQLEKGKRTREDGSYRTLKPGMLGE